MSFARTWFCSFQETVIWLYKPEGGEKVEKRSKTEPWAVPVVSSPSQTAACRLPQVGVKKPWLTVGLQVWVSMSEFLTPRTDAVGLEDPAE